MKSTVRIEVTLNRAVTDQEAEAAMYAACELLRVNTSDESAEDDWSFDVREAQP
jgi:hypothetical protein